MIDQILIGSCEHQRYRRAAQLAMLEYHRYPLRIIDVVWGKHADYTDAAVILDSLRGMGAVSLRTDLKYVYSSSNTELKMRMLHRIMETAKNTIMIEDDHFLIIDYKTLCKKIKRLSDRIGTELGVINLFPRGANRVSDQPVIPIAGADDFEKGCWSSGHHMLFVTPYGAERLLAYMKDPTTPTTSLENAWKHLLDKDWIYSAIPDKKRLFVKSLSCIQGKSIGTRLTETGQEIRRTADQMERQERYIEHFKL